MLQPKPNQSQTKRQAQTQITQPYPSQLHSPIPNNYTALSLTKVIEGE